MLLYMLKAIPGTIAPFFFRETNPFGVAHRASKSASDIVLFPLTGVTVVRGLTRGERDVEGRASKSASVIFFAAFVKREFTRGAGADDLQPGRWP